MAAAAVHQRLSGDALIAFAVFGLFWGAWGASIPRIQRQANVDDGRLGLALVCVGAGALPAMLLAGRAIDRFGLRVAGLVLPLLCVAGAAMSLVANDFASLSVALGITGAASGASDVAINSVAGYAERCTGIGVITRAHATFSSLVVLGSLGVAATSGASLPVSAPFLAVAAVSVIAGVRLMRGLARANDPSTDDEAENQAEESATGYAASVVPLLLLGALGALALASENAHQSWSAVFVHQVLHAGTGVAATAPAIFAGVVALARFSISRVAIHHATGVLVAGSATAALGATLLAAAPNLGVAMVGLATAAAGTAVLFPTLMRVVTHAVAEERRGHATSVVASVSYLGFLLGPVYVGLSADATGLRGAMLAVAVLGALLVLLTPTLFRLAGLRTVAESNHAADGAPVGRPVGPRRSADPCR